MGYKYIKRGPFEIYDSPQRISLDYRSELSRTKRNGFKDNNSRIKTRSQKSKNEMIKKQDNKRKKYNEHDPMEHIEKKQLRYRYFPRKYRNG